MNATLIIVLGVLVLVGILVVVVGRRGVRWYTVYMANPEQNETVYRTLGDRWWALDAGAFVTFRRRDGQKVRLGKHWIQKIVSESDAKR